MKKKKQKKNYIVLNLFWWCKRGKGKSCKNNLMRCYDNVNDLFLYY